jgi:hypothetical protein
MIDCTKRFVLGNAGCLYIKLHTNTQNKIKRVVIFKLQPIAILPPLKLLTPPLVHHSFTVIMASCGFCHFSLSGSTVVTDRLIGPCHAKALTHVMNLWTGGCRTMIGQRGNIISEGKCVLLYMGQLGVPCSPSQNGHFILSLCLFVVLFNLATPLL